VEVGERAPGQLIVEEAVDPFRDGVLAEVERGRVADPVLADEVRACVHR
jgi:hypothetical protein